MARELNIVDADAHTFNPKDMWERWLPKQYQDQRPRLVKDHKGGDAWQFDPKGQPEPLGLTFTAGMRYQDFKWYGLTYDTIRKGCYDGKARLADMDEDGVDAQILYSDNRPMSYFMSVPDKGFHLAAIQAYNNWLKDEFCSVDPQRLIGLAQIPNLGIEASVSELKRAKDMGFKSAIIRAWPSGKSEISLEDDPYWASCEQMGMPVTNHGFATTMRSNGLIKEGPASAIGMGTGIATNMIPFMTQLIATGVFDRFPKLKVGSIETQIGWIPFVLEQMDDHYFRNRYWGNVNIKFRPSEYWKKNWFATFMIDKYGIANRNWLGSDTLLWSTDYPHHGNDWPFSRKVIENEFAGVPEEETKKIVCDNAVRLFNLK